jgi:hypothetical protein
VGLPNMLAGRQQACRQAGNHNNRQAGRNSCRQTDRQADRRSPEGPGAQKSISWGVVEICGSPKHAGR